MSNSDLKKVQTRHIQSLFSAPGKDLRKEDIVSRAIYQISTSSYSVISSHLNSRFIGKKISEPDILKNLKASAEWTLALFYLLEIEPPEMEEITDLADTMYEEMAVDPVLAALQMQSSLSDLAICNFCYENDDNKEEMDQDLGEILASHELICRRLDSSLENIL